MTPGDAYWVGVAELRKSALCHRCRKYLYYLTVVSPDASSDSSSS